MVGWIISGGLAISGLALIVADRNGRVSNIVKQLIWPKYVDEKFIQQEITESLRLQQSFSEQLYNDLLEQNERVCYVHDVASNTLTQMDNLIEQTRSSGETTELRTLSRERTLLENEIKFYDQIETDLADMMADAKRTSESSDMAVNVAVRQRTQRQQATNGISFVLKFACLIMLVYTTSVILWSNGFFAEGGKALSSVVSAQSTEPEDEQVGEVPSVIAFEVGSASLTAVADSILDKLITDIGTESVVNIEGYTSSIEESKLGRERAETIAAFLIDNGVGRERIEIQSVANGLEPRADIYLEEKIWGGS